MARVRYSRSARSDVMSILETSLEGWGAEGRARYQALLMAATRAIADEPDGSTTRAHAQLGSGVRCFHLRHTRGDHGVRSPVHVIYYRVIDAEQIEIIGVLHERMDPGRHFSNPVKAVHRTRRAR